MDNFAEALAAMSDMKRDGVVSEYAVGRAMALIFWSEPTATFDLDVFVLLEQTGLLVSLDQIYKWTRARVPRTGRAHHHCRNSGAGDSSP